MLFQFGAVYLEKFLYPIPSADPAKAEGCEVAKPVSRYGNSQAGVPKGLL